MGESKGLFWGLIAVSSILILSVLAQFASAVGIILVEDNRSYIPGNVTSEYVAIHHEQGWENIGVIITTGPSEKGFWIIPLPNESFKVQPLSQFPKFEGEELGSFSKERLGLVFELILDAQVLALPVTSWRNERYLPHNWFKNTTDRAGADSLYAVGMQNDIIKPGELDSYLGIRNVKLGEFADIFKPYEDAESSYAIIWFNKINTSISRGIWLSFKTDAPYYPGELSRYYSNGHPVEIYVTQHARADLAQEAGIYRIEQLYQPGYAPDVPALFYNNKTKRDLEYTKLFLSESHQGRDIMFSEVAQEDMAYLKSIANHPLLWGIIIYLIVSVLASMTAGTIVFWGDRPHALQFFIFGLNNFLTLPGFWAMAYMRSVDEAFSDLESKIPQRVELTKLQRFILAVPSICLSIIIVTVPIALFLGLGPIVNPIFLSNAFLYWLIPGLVFLILILWGVFRQPKVLLFNVVFTITFLMMLFLAYIVMVLFI